MNTPHSPGSATTGTTAATDSESALRMAFSTCCQKARLTIPLIGATQRSGALSIDGDYFSMGEGFFDIGNWTTSFFAGMGALSYELSGDTEILRQLNSLADLYREKVTSRSMDTMHDLGFLYSLYSVALYKLTGSLDHRDTALRAADVLAKRYVPKGGYIRAWGRMDDHVSDYAGLAIIDCMMNLPLLFWASEETGNPFHREIAIRHADTTLACFIRPDDSVFHAYRFDLKTGAPLRGDNYCGYSVDTHWARGTAWAIYGFAIAFRYTRDPRYLDVTRRLAYKFCGLLDAEQVPVWEFRLPAGFAALRDSSAAAIAACGMQELRVHFPKGTDLAATIDAILAALCTRYVNHDPACLGVLKDAQVGDGKIDGSPHYQARNAYTSWGDYFLMEALARRLHGLVSYW